MKDQLIKVFSIKKNDIISITGSGGKTSLMFALAKKLRNYGKVLVTTSAKMLVPEKKDIDYLYTSFKDYKKNNKDKSITVIGQKIEGKEKLAEIGQENLLKIKDDFDFILIEADGCRNLSLKYWKKHEPIIYKLTKKTIAVFPISLVGRKVSEDFIYNYKEFKDNINQEQVDKNLFLSLINSYPGPFKDFSKDKYVFFNQADNDNLKEESRQVISFLKEENDKIKYVYGSVLKEKYYEN